MEVENSIRFARAFAAKSLIWFSPALYRCRIVLSAQVEVAAIDKHFNIYWNPKFVKLMLDKIPDKKRLLSELGFIWVHEISHVLRAHFDRSSDIGASATKWNYAADMEINDSKWEGLSPPSLFPIVTPDLFGLPNNKTVEWYYKNLQSNKCASKKNQCNETGNSKNSGDSDSGSGNKNENDQPNDGHSQKKEDDYGGAGKPKPWDDGSGVDGNPRPWEKSDNNTQTMTDMARTVLNRDVARRMKASMTGTLPGGWNVWVQNTLEPKIDWRKILKNKLSTAIAVGRGSRIDYTFSRPNRRASIYSPIIIPSLSGTQSTQLTVVIDTSGSMYGALISQAVAELFGILKSVHQTVNLIPCDAKAYEPIELRTPSDIRKLIELQGGGGTNMVAGIEFAVKQKPIPDTVLVLTDGYTPYPLQKYKIPVIFGIIGQNQINPRAIPKDPPWGSDTIVFIDLAF